MNISYDATTDNGIKYISSLYSKSFDYQIVIDDLDALYVVRSSVLSGEGNVESYSIGSRSLTRKSLSASEVLSLWGELMAKKKQLEMRRKPRKAVGVVLRDW